MLSFFLRTLTVPPLGNAVEFLHATIQESEQSRRKPHWSPVKSIGLKRGARSRRSEPNGARLDAPMLPAIIRHHLPQFNRGVRRQPWCKPRTEGASLQLTRLAALMRNSPNPRQERLFNGRVRCLSLVVQVLGTLSSNNLRYGGQTISASS
jgi:hypothetical protein